MSRKPYSNAPHAGNPDPRDRYAEAKTYDGGRDVFVPPFQIPSGTHSRAVLEDVGCDPATVALVQKRHGVDVVDLVTFAGVCTEERVTAQTARVWARTGAPAGRVRQWRKAVTRCGATSSGDAALLRELEAYLDAVAKDAGVAAHTLPCERK